MKAGIAEAVKNALISSPALATSLRARLRSDCRYAAAELRELALSAILAKLEILRRDPSEKRYALVLEYGQRSPTPSSGSRKARCCTANAWPWA